MNLSTRIRNTSKPRVTVLAITGVIVIATAIWGVSRWLSRERGSQEQARTTARSMAGMDMSRDGSVQLTADQIRQFGITFGSVEQRTLTDRVRAVGSVRFDETRMAGVAARFSGYIERLYVDFTGKVVRRGQPLLEIYSPDLVAAQNELLLAARLEREGSISVVPGVPSGSSNLLSAARQRLRLWDISEAQIDQVLREGKVRRTLTLFAPVSGVVTEKHILAGQAVQPGQALYTIADLSRVWIETELREADAGLVRIGDAASVEIATYPGRPIEGRVEYVYPTLQQDARTLVVRISAANPDGRLKPGMYATVWLSAPQRATLTIPLAALVRTGNRQIVFVDMGSGRIMPHEVTAGRIAGEYAEVIAGLEPGQRVVTSAQFLLDSESNLAEVMKALVGQMNMSDIGSHEMPGMESRGADMRNMKMPGKER
ncbi:MAG: efflux RND transporter periplasmic adaptor subunit [Longimicrobiales bacterium]